MKQIHGVSNWGLTQKAYNSEEKGCQRCRSQGHKEDREDLEERDSTTRQHLAICYPKPSHRKLPANILLFRGQRIFGIISLHYARLFFARKWATALACQERAMAPFLAMTSRHTFLRPSAQAAATRRACCERQMARTRALNAVFPKAGRPACRSSRSRWRSRFRSQERQRRQGHDRRGIISIATSAHGVPFTVLPIELGTAALSSSGSLTLRRGPGMASRKGSGSLPPGLCERMLGSTKSSSTGDPLYNATPPAVVRQCHKTDSWHQQLGL